MRNRIAIIGLTLLLAGCTGTAPQRPSQRKGASPQADTTALAMMELNQQLARAADEQILHLVQAQPEPYALYERGGWAFVEQKGDTDRPVRNGEECTVRMIVYNLSGERYTDSEKTACVGKYELPAALDENMPEWYHGAHVRMYAPWYAAYGIKGKGTIPPYENVIIELEIK